ncbi:MAG: M20/M25/M40 family metallo-hydrolase [Bacteroidetes bacterium]|nr:M20/M25/M40 family metallo-hydrolase [Bacteroidota bacterium]
MAVNVLQILEGLVAIPSLSREEKAAADFVQQTVESAGVYCNRSGDNVWFGIGEGDTCLLLNSHLDVVPPSQDHPYDPFTPTRVDGRLFGRGSVDAKASGSAMTAAVLQLAAEGWRPEGGRVVVALTTCEELGGGYNGLEDTRPKLPRVSSAIVGEPTQLQPCIAQKGLLILRVDCRGRSAHAARSAEGINAIEIAARDILATQSMTFDKADSYLGPVTSTVTVVEGGTARNVVPDLCKFWIDVRSTPVYTHEELTALFSDTLEGEVNVHSDRFHPVSTESDTDIVESVLRAGTTLGREMKPFGSPTMSDWIFLRDVPCVKLGPGDSNLSHTGRESIELAEVEAAVEVYKETIRAYFRR